jgi:nucleotide-binding universal stress UspA family protein
MAYKNILVHLDQTSRSAARFTLALDLAKRQQSSLSVYYATSMPYLGQGLEKQHREQVQAACLEQAQQAGVDCVWVGEEADMVHQSLEARLNYQAFFADLTLLGQPGADAGAPPAPPRDLPNRVILTSGRPILTIPFAGNFSHVGSRVMVAWRSGRSSSRAVFDALPLLAQADLVHLLCFANTNDERSQGEKSLKRLADFLALHGAKTTTEVRLISNIGFGDALLNRAAEEGIDLLVAGGALPSAPAPLASQLLKQMTVPVLMSS